MIYTGGNAKNLSSEPISKLLPVGNQAGIRYGGNIESPFIGVLFSTFEDIDWPDRIKGNVLIYYGDNKSPDREIHETPGNKFLRNIFGYFHLKQRIDIPPIFLFSKQGQGFERRFDGLVVPGNYQYDQSSDLVAIWQTKNGKRFQNYRAVFTILDTQVISRKWIEDISAGNAFSKNCPEIWRIWINDGNK
jgi:hypothetical protein